MKKSKKWYDFLWGASAVYLALGFFNILFAWLGMICFLVPLGFAVFGGSKGYCNRYCGRGQLFELLGSRLSRNRPTPGWIGAKWWRYGFLTFFLLMFINMLFSTWLVFSGSRNLHETVTLLWTFRLPWHFAYQGTAVAPWVAQFAFGFYSLMLTSTILGMVSMLLWKPRSWCVWCPMGTMTQAICKLKRH
ncbi:4Fe-4S binding protein [Anaerotruncus rubiinfantis]|uniref:4Fe-4S binding protein n=1 Tax=Anaerotruncus rubiinfantis TaxID=1720200 RepID=UPI003D7A742C